MTSLLPCTLTRSIRNITSIRGPATQGCKGIGNMASTFWGRFPARRPPQKTGAVYEFGVMYCNLLRSYTITSTNHVQVGDECNTQWKSLLPWLVNRSIRIPPSVHPPIRLFPSGSLWEFLGDPWEPLRALGSLWEHLGATGSFWELLRTPRGFWELLLASWSF